MAAGVAEGCEAGAGFSIAAAAVVVAAAPICPPAPPPPLASTSSSSIRFISALLALAPATSAASPRPPPSARRLGAGAAIRGERFSSPPLSLDVAAGILEKQRKVSRRASKKKTKKTLSLSFPLSFFFSHGFTSFFAQNGAKKKGTDLPPLPRSVLFEKRKKTRRGGGRLRGVLIGQNKGDEERGKKKRQVCFRRTKGGRNSFSLFYIFWGTSRGRPEERRGKGSALISSYCASAMGVSLSPPSPPPPPPSFC